MTDDLDEDPEFEMVPYPDFWEFREINGLRAEVESLTSENARLRLTLENISKVGSEPPLPGEPWSLGIGRVAKFIQKLVRQALKDIDGPSQQ